MEHVATPGAELRPVVVQPSLREYVRRSWSRREFLWELSTSSLRTQHLDTVLGNVWHVLNPALSVSVYYLIFGLILGTDRGLDNFIGFLSIGVFTYGLLTKTVQQAGRSLTNNVGLMRSLRFPRVLLPLSVVVREVVGYSFALLVMLVVLLVTGEPVRATWVLAPLLVALLVLFAAGLGLLVARVTDRVRDISNILPFVFRLIFYGSGIIFALTSFIRQETVDRLHVPLTAAQVRHIFTLNPFFTYIELLRDTLMTTYTAEHPTSAWVVALVAGPITFVIGLVFFLGGESEYGRG